MEIHVSRRVRVVVSAIMLFGASAASAQVQVVNMIPAAMSDESNRDSEPYVAVNPNNPQLIAATAFMITPSGSSNGPLLVSTNGGTSWVTQNVIPSSSGGLNTFDVTLRFNSAGTALYAALLRNSSVNLEIHRTTDMTLTTPFTTFNTPRLTDQPYIYSRTVTGWFDPGKDRIWIGNNDAAANPNSATLDQSLDAAIAMPTVTQIRIDAGMPVGRDNYQVRTVAHPDGHVYGAFYRRTGSITGGYNVDVVVVRDDDWGKGMNPFRDLLDSTTMVAGQHVASNIPVSDTMGSSTALGREWWGGDLYLSVDPNNAARVYISYSDSQSGAARTIHLRRSTDFGQTWSADLLTIASAKNAAIAINSHGTIAYLYQRLAGTSPNLRWETRLRRSTDDGATWNDELLADFPAEGTGSPTGSRIIGDYLNMVAVGKHFYGVFSSYNDQVSATFPAGITWLRNRAPNGDPMPRLLGVDGVTTVTPSIDPFFFRTTEIAADADFYVRDWTDNATTRDHGQEPSVRNDFYSTSDVWNRRTNDPQPFDGNDRPQVQDPQPTSMGSNFAFTRVTREASGSAATVTLSYLYSDGGVGVPYVSAGPSTSVSFAAGDTAVTPAAGAGYQWELPSGASNHVCLAVEIATAGDPLLSPSLLGHAPGWPTTDLLVVADNNKAQRNMHVFGFGGMSGAEESMSMYAIVQNAATRWRNVQIGIGQDRRLLRPLRVATLRILGRTGGQPRPVRAGDVLTLPKMAPGEKRWVELSFTPGASAGPARVEILELVNGHPVNGYAFAPTPMPFDQAIRETLVQHAATFNRIAAAFGIDGAKAQAAAALKVLELSKITPATYQTFVKTESPAVGSVAVALLKTAGGDDPFGVAAAIKRLAAATSAGVMQPRHLSLLNKLDAFQTMRQKASGDAADIPQNVRWQRDLFLAMQTPRAKEVVESSTRFLNDFQRKKVGVEGFAPLLTSLDGALQEAAEKYGVAQTLKQLDPSTVKSPTALQKVHREFLLALDAIVRPAVR